MKKDDEEFVSLSIILFSDFPGLSASSPVPRKRDLAHTYWAHNPLNSRGFNGKRTEHQIGEGFTEIDTRALVSNDHYIIPKNTAKEREFSALSLLRFPFFWQFSCPILHSNILGIVWFLIDRSSLLRKKPDRQLMSENINFNSFSNISGLAHDPWR